MGTGHHDIDGTEINEGDVLQSVHDPSRRGVVVRFDKVYLIECGAETDMLKYRIDDAHEWRIIGGIRNAPNAPNA